MPSPPSPADCHYRRGRDGNRMVTPFGSPHAGLSAKRLSKSRAPTSSAAPTSITPLRGVGLGPFPVEACPPLVAHPERRLVPPIVSAAAPKNTRRRIAKSPCHCEVCATRLSKVICNLSMGVPQISESLHMYLRTTTTNAASQYDSALRCQGEVSETWATRLHEEVRSRDARVGESSQAYTAEQKSRWRCVECPIPRRSLPRVSPSQGHSSLASFATTC